MIKTGDTLPSAQLTLATPDGPQPSSTDELFKGHKVVLFAVPGAFTPTCSARHLPGFVDNLDAFKDRGIDRVVCLAVNDPFVLRAWAKDGNVGPGITMIADGAARFTQALGMDQDMSARDFGVRSRRFAMVVDDGVVVDVAVEEAGEFEVSKAESVLSRL